MEAILRRYHEKHEQISLSFVREFYHSVDWNDRLIGIKGQRGVGKTTLLLQFIKMNLKLDNETLYASLDHIYFSSNSLYGFAELFVAKGGKNLFLDEVHRYQNWIREIKNIYDDFPGLKIVFTGSSMIQIRKASADLSRRAVVYEMPGLSFREFLYFETGQKFQKLSLKQILEEHSLHATKIMSKVRPLAYFGHYLDHGYYTFYLENVNTFHLRLTEVINTVLEVDIPWFEDVQTSHIPKLKLLLLIISESVPFKPNIQKMAERIGISVNTLKNYLYYLADAGLVNLVQSRGKGLTRLSKPEKIYLNNPNLMYNLCGDKVQIGTARESFFVNQVMLAEKLEVSPETDFIVNGKYSFEIGGRGKSREQTIGLSDAFIIKDDIEIGMNNQVPLWLFGFLT